MGIEPDDWEWTLGKTMHDNTDAYPRMPGYGLFLDPPYEINGNAVVGGQWVIMGAKDLARFGLLVATGGIWEGKRLIGRAQGHGGGNGSYMTGIGGPTIGSIAQVTSTFNYSEIPWDLFTEPPMPGSRRAPSEVP